jgi:hypothetical protein
MIHGTREVELNRKLAGVDPHMNTHVAANGNKIFCHNVASAAAFLTEGAN